MITLDRGSTRSGDRFIMLTELAMLSAVPAYGGALARRARCRRPPARRAFRTTSAATVPCRTPASSCVSGGLRLASRKRKPGSTAGTMRLRSTVATRTPQNCLTVHTVCRGLGRVIQGPHPEPAQMASRFELRSYRGTITSRNDEPATREPRGGSGIASSAAAGCRRRDDGRWHLSLRSTRRKPRFRRPPSAHGSARSPRAR